MRRWLSPGLTLAGAIVGGICLGIPLSLSVAAVTDFLSIAGAFAPPNGPIRLVGSVTVGVMGAFVGLLLARRITAEPPRRYDPDLAIALGVLAGAAGYRLSL